MGEFLWELKMAMRYEDEVEEEEDSDCDSDDDDDELNAFLDEVGRYAMANPLLHIFNCRVCVS